MWLARNTLNVAWFRYWINRLIWIPGRLRHVYWVSDKKSKTIPLLQFSWAEQVTHCRLHDHITLHLFFFFVKIWNTSWMCVSSSHGGHANLVCIISILVYVLPKRALTLHLNRTGSDATMKLMNIFSGCITLKRLFFNVFLR